VTDTDFNLDATSIVCVPMEPVEPRMAISFNASPYSPEKVKTIRVT
jgi:hypothetical protein